MNKVVCPDCGGNLMYKEMHQYMQVWKVGSSGKIYKRSRKLDQGAMEVVYIQCSKCGRRFDIDEYTISQDGNKVILE